MILFDIKNKCNDLYKKKIKKNVIIKRILKMEI